jgi:outer membrane protein OmpA-like peptidoglycan-associated protein
MLLLQYAREPFVLRGADGLSSKPVRDQWQAHVLASYALWHRLLLAFDLPTTLVETGDGAEPPLPSASAPAIGDVRALARWQPLGDPGDGVHAALEVDVWAPTGASDSYSSDSAARAGAFVIVGGVHDRLAWSAETGAVSRPNRTYSESPPLRVGPLWTVAASAKWAFDARRALELGPEAVAQLGIGSAMQLLDARTTSLHVLLGARFRFAAGPWFIAVAGGPGVGEAIGVADYRAVLSAGWSVEREPPPPDRDQDGVADVSDACIDVRGIRSSDPMMNGCPELPADADGDAVPDRFDACPRVGGSPHADRHRNGCPEEVAERPAPPQPAPVAQLEQERITINQEVRFETGTASLHPDSEAILRAVADVLLAHPEIVAIEVQGHTDATGAPEANLELSERRAAAVVDWLVRYGIAAARLRARGFGETQPVSDNTVEDGRRRNRRVEFRIAERRALGPAAPPAEGAPK